MTVDVSSFNVPVRQSVRFGRMIDGWRIKRNTGNGRTEKDEERK